MANLTGKVKWGILGVAGIAVRKVIPAMQKGEFSTIAAIASRDQTRAKEAAASLGIPKEYGSYEELLADPDIEAIYNPLPNHLHLPWTTRAAEAGKHVLCEKPIGMNAAEARQLVEVAQRTGVKIGEAFMVRTHPQWIRTREIILSGEIGELQAISGHFSYFNADPANIRNVPAYGGGGLMDIGCYPIHTARFIFGSEPLRVSGLVSYDPQLKTDRLACAMLQFPAGYATFTCSTQMAPYQRMHFFGTKGRIEIEIPFNAPNDRPCRIAIDNGADVFGSGIRYEEFPVCDQYTIQGDEFSKAIRGLRPVPVSTEDAIGNMSVIDAIFPSAQKHGWEIP